MLGLHMPEILAIVAVILLVFGAKRLPEMGSNVAKGIKEFKKGINDEDTPKTDDSATQIKSIEANKLEVDAIERELARKKAELAAQESVKGERAASAE